ncbi:hypothetical protein [Microvirga lotononidis]|uniref:Uncharacterized protein n=1 Tax=Microvirga lotononidis TaxID=864069 RepID=I4Z3A4_9HYPH|nr:hypothetical protein [Microvirga lotononidis]EIM30696.1 hypothetical protein MicloDRAFT_00005990 [Microvirga lotononidis]
MPSALPGQDHGYPHRLTDRCIDHDSSRSVVVDRFADDMGECRVIAKRRYNRFGELLIKRIRICGGN